MIIVPSAPVRRRAKKDRIIGMGLDVFLEILRAFESFAAKIASVWFQRNVNANVRSNVVAFYYSNVAVGPTTLQVEVVGAFAPNMHFTNMILVSHEREQYELHRF